MDSYTIIDQTLPNPMVSVAMVTYNHESFIAEAIESVLMQITTFSLQLVIAEDCSTDKTREIVLQYQRKFPDIIKLILQNKNVGAVQNNLDLLSNLSGKYIAALEGDDYWIDVHKLAQQVNFLEKNKEYILCAHQVNKLNFKQQIEQPLILEQSFSFTQEDIYQVHIPTLSVVFRNKFNKIPKELELSPSGDYIIWSYLGQFGDFFMINKIMGVYRQQAGGAWSGVNIVNQIKNSVITRTLSLNFLRDKSKSINFNAKLCRSGAYQSLKHLDIKNFIFFVQQYFNNIFKAKLIK